MARNFEQVEFFRTYLWFKVCLFVLTDGQELKVGEYNAIADILDLNNTVKFQGKKQSRLIQNTRRHLGSDPSLNEKTSFPPDFQCLTMVLHIAASQGGYESLPELAG